MLLQELSRSRLFDAFREMERLQGQFNRLFEGYNAWRSSEFPPVNVWVNQDSAVVTCELPGLNADDIDISVVNNTLTLRGSRSQEELKPGQTQHRQERPHGEFSRSLQLPFKVNGDNVKATFKKGVLQLTVPRAEEDKPRKVCVCSQ